MPKQLINVRVTGVEKILRRYNRRNPIYAEPWVSALKEAASLVQTDLQRGAPGTLGATITTRLHARPVPLYAKVGLLPMPSRKGFRYPGALQGGAMYHYRSGPLTGRPTKGWLKEPLSRLAGKIEELLGRAGREIERAWESGS